jgi:GNAT superfamily N-acetyltransferase
VLTIRRAEAVDVAVLQSIVAEAYLPYVARIGRPPGPMHADYAAAVATGEAYLAVTAAGAGAVVGLLILVPEPDHLLLENVAVRPSAQGTGIGSRLLEFAEERARELGLSEIRLYTHELMTENQALYARRGYRETHRAETAGLRRVFFTKQLPPR